MGPNVHVPLRLASDATRPLMNGGVIHDDGNLLQDDSAVPLGQLSQLLTGCHWDDVISLIHQYPSEIAQCTMKVVCQGENYNVTPLHFAVGCIMNCPVSVLEALVQAHPAALISADSRRRLTPIHLGLLKGTVGVEQIDFLLSACPEMALHADLDGNLPLHMAVEYASDTIIKKLLSACPESLVYKTKRQRHVLHLLASSRCQIGDLNGAISINTIQSIVEAYPEALQHPDLQGRLPLHLAVCTPFPRWDVIELFSHTYPAALLMQDENHKIPLQLLKRFSPPSYSMHSSESALSTPVTSSPDNDVILALVTDMTNAEKRKNNVFHKYLGKVIPLKKKHSTTAFRNAAMPAMDLMNCYG